MEGVCFIWFPPPPPPPTLTNWSLRAHISSVTRLFKFYAGNSHFSREIKTYKYDGWHISKVFSSPSITEPCDLKLLTNSPKNLNFMTFVDDLYHMSYSYIDKDTMCIIPEWLYVNLICLWGNSVMPLPIVHWQREKRKEDIQKWGFKDLFKRYIPNCQQWWFYVFNDIPIRQSNVLMSFF